MKNSEELKEEALSLIRKWDKERGEGWSDDSYEIVDIMIEFYNLQKLNTNSLSDLSLNEWQDLYNKGLLDE